MSAWSWIQASLFIGAIFMWPFGDHETAWFALTISALMELAEINEAIWRKSEKER